MQHRTEGHELFRKYARDMLGCVDLGHSDSPQTNDRWRPLDEYLHAQFGDTPYEALAQHRETVPGDLRILAARHLFEPLGGYRRGTESAISGEHVAVWPETSTFLTKCAINAAAAHRPMKRKPIVLIPEGNFRYNYSIEDATNAQLALVPVDDRTKKITPLMLDGVIRMFEKGRVIALILETPNNPWMQTYSADEMRGLLRTALRHDLIVINDLYLAETETPGIERVYAAAAIDSDFGSPLDRERMRNKLVTVRGTRRVFGADKRGKGGFAASHNAELIEEMIRLIRAVHMRWNAGRYFEVRWILEQSPVSAGAASLAAIRAEAESMYAAVDGVRVIVPSQAGPFITVGFSKPVEERLARLGFTDESGSLDGYRIAEFLAFTSAASGCGALFMPLCAMSTATAGFRINAAVATDELSIGASALGRMIMRLSSGVRYDTVAGDIEAVYRRIREIGAAKLCS